MGGQGQVGAACGSRAKGGNIVFWKKPKLSASPDPEVESVMMLLQRVGFAIGGECEIRFIRQSGLLEPHYDALAVGKMRHHQVDDGTGHAGFAGFAVEILGGVALYPHTIRLGTISKIDTMSAAALRTREPLLPRILEDSTVGTDKLDAEVSQNPALPWERESIASIISLHDDGIFTEDEVIHFLCQTYKDHVTNCVRNFNDGEISSSEFVSMVAAARHPAP